MASDDFVTRKEITTQTSAWSEAIDVVERSAPAIGALELASYRQVLCVGCGSTYYLALSAASLLQSRTGVVVRPFPASELLLNPRSANVDGKSLLVAFSRSGATSETVRVVADFKARGLGTVVTVTNYGQSPLAGLGHVSIVVKAGQETSVAQTRSFASMLVAVTGIADLLGPDPMHGSYKSALVESGNRLIRDHEEMARRLGTDRAVQQVFFLGSGLRYGLACEVSLKLKEMSQTVSEPFHFMEFRHGPISMVDGNTLVVGLLSDTGRDQEAPVLEEVRALGGRTLSIGETGTDVELRSGLAEDLRGALYLPVLQLFAYHRAVSRGKNPDKPRNLVSVVELSLDGQ